MKYTGKLYRAELYQDNTWPYTNVKAVYEANRDRFPGKRLIVTNGHWCEGVKPCPWYRVNGEWLATMKDAQGTPNYWNCWGLSWSGNEKPQWAVSDWDGVGDNFLCTIPVLRNGVRQDVSMHDNSGVGGNRVCNRTWWGWDAAGKCTVEVTTIGYTLKSIIDRMESLGIVDGIVLDGSGSSQWYDGVTWYRGSDGRTIYEFLLLWFEPEIKENVPEIKDNDTGIEKPKVYLSPSSQPANTYSAGDTNEQAQCNRIADFCKAALERCGFEVKKAPEGQAFQKNVAESNAWGADLHVPIHTNAGGGRGPVVFVSGLTERRLKYAQPVYDALWALAPDPGTYGVRANPGLYECGYTNAICVYCECAFHDNAAEAAFIVANVAALGEAIAKGICAGAGVAYVGAEQPEAPEPETTQDAAGTIYRVQVGAFSDKRNAENYKKKLENAGFGGAFIVAAGKEEK